MTALAYLECPVCGNDGMANTGRMDAEGNQVNRGGEPSWTEDDEGPCVSCGVIVRVIIDDDQEAQLVEVSE